MLHIIFWEPEIPGNTGAAIRLSAFTRCSMDPVQADRRIATTSRTSWCTNPWTTRSRRFRDACGH